MNDDFGKDTSNGSADLDKLYRQSSRELPPEHLDNAILAAAAKEAGVKSRRRPTTHTPRWSIPVSLAAVLVLSVSLVTFIYKESPRKIVHEEDPVAAFLADESANARSRSAPTAETEAKEETTPLPLLRSPAPATKQAPSSDLAEPERSRRKPLMSAPSTQQQLQRQPQQDAQKQTEVDVPLKKAKPAGSVPRQADEKRAEAATELHADSLAAQAQQQENDAAPSIDAEERALRRRALGSGLPAQPNVADETVLCVSLSQAACLRSTQCTLAFEGPEQDTTSVYICRPSLSSCEQGFIQQTQGKAECEAKPGCRFKPGSCFCPSGMTCVCGGGPPPQCMRSTDDAQ
jgi:hypothetical protein